MIRWLQLRGAAVRNFNVLLHDSLYSRGSGHCTRVRDAGVLMLPQLMNLHHLEINTSGRPEFMVPERHLQAIEFLPNSQQLHLSMPSDGTWCESTLEPPKNMRALTSLNLSIYDMLGPLLVSPLLTQLTQLQDLHLRHWSRCKLGVSQAHLMQTISKLTGLKTLRLHHMVESIPAELERLACLTCLELKALDLQRSHFATPPPLEMCAKLRHICLGWLFQARDNTWQSICTSLLLLPELDTLDIRYVDLSTVQPSSWALSLGLTSLNLLDCSISLFPLALCCLPRLERLSVRDSDVQLASLPRGSYLRNLHSLYMNEPIPAAGPEALTDAVHLRNLVIHDTGMHYPGLLWTNSALRQVVPTGCNIVLKQIDDDDDCVGRVRA